MKAGEHKDYKTPIPPPEDSWEFKLGVPGWIAGVDGTSGINGHAKQSDIKADQILRRVDMTASFRGEASKGRFGIMGDFLYLSLSDGIGTNTMVKKLDIQLDEVIAELALRWRVVQTERCSLDIFGGVRYVNIHQAAVLQPNDPRINEVATVLSAPGREIIRRLAEDLGSLDRLNADLPVAPLTADQRSRLAQAIGRIAGNADERKEKIEKLLHDALDQRISRTDDWWDPFIGLRGQVSLSEKCYFSAKGDIGGFGVGSDFAWQAEAVFGVSLTPRHYAELGYRALSMDYDKDGLIVDTVTHGAIVTLGMKF